jgi:hypothetical protein
LSCICVLCFSMIVSLLFQFVTLPYLRSDLHRE